MSICKYCNKNNKELNLSSRSFSSHVRNCSMNPNLKKIWKKIAISFQNKRKNFTFLCLKCSKKFELKLTKHQYDFGLHKKYCCRPCSNSRKHTEGIKLKISVAMQGKKWSVSQRKKLSFNYNSKEYKKKISLKMKQWWDSNPQKKVEVSKRMKIIGKRIPKEHFRKMAKLSPISGRFRKKVVKYRQKDGLIVNLDSSYEVKVAKELDKYNINWIRPKFIRWVDSQSNNRKYFPDFYLIDYDVYLDPKNDYLIKKDKIKIESVCKQNKIKIIILDKNHLSWKKIKKSL
ncbi:MAG TPA: hypothetical protein VMV43_10025 [Candidatus Nanopelagicaceae bacterium]|nr:hypothetical protein [Candidatus Nanopelagicaceae bacterium]